MELQKGANAPVDGGTIEINWTRQPGKAEVDVSAYLLDASDKVQGDAGMVFYGQLEAGGIALTTNQAAKRANFLIEVAQVPATIERIAFCVALDTSQDPGRRLADAGSIIMQAGSHRFEINMAGMSEQALIVCEVYRRNGEFKIRAVGQGFNGGLGPLAMSFGVDVEGDAQETSAPTPAPAPTHAAAPTPTVSLKKVTLGKSEKVNLDKKGGAIRARLIWGGRGKGEGDLDFYCYYVLKDGTCGTIYWKNLGKPGVAPFITLSGDSQAAGEEEIVLNKPDELRYALFAAYSAVSNGAGSFKSYRPKMILTDQLGSEVTIPLLNPNASSYWVAISHLSMDQVISVEHVETYGKSGLAVIAAERSPRLHKDGSWDVSKGKVEFKPK